MEDTRYLLCLLSSISIIIMTLYFDEYSIFGVGGIYIPYEWRKARFGFDSCVCVCGLCGWSASNEDEDERQRIGGSQI
jgi:hypothetical protein